MIIEELLGEDLAKDGVTNKEEYFNERRKIFVKNLNELIGKKVNEELKGPNNQYIIPVESKSFVKELINRDDDMRALVRWNRSPETRDKERGVLGSENAVEQDVYLLHVQYELCKLFKACKKEKVQEIMTSFNERNVPYLEKTEEALKKLNNLFEQAKSRPFVDRVMCLSIYAELERCTQHIRYAQKRATSELFFVDELKVNFRKIEEWLN